MKITEEQQKRRIEISKLKSAIQEVIPEGVEITSILIALADLTREYSLLLVRLFEEENNHD